MWTCPQCRTQNQDHDTACVNCGAIRAAGRFSSNQHGARTPRVTSASDPSSAQPPARGGYSLPETGVQPRPPKRSPVIVMARFAGILLATLLPVLTVLLSWRQSDALKHALLPLLLPTGTPEWQGTVCYIVLAFIAALLSLLPGLWTLLLARRSLPPPRNR